MKKINVLGIDPGFDGALVLTDLSTLKYWKMPVSVEGKTKRIDHEAVFKILISVGPHVRVYLEKPVSFGMSPRGAFNYGRGYESILVALRTAWMKVELVEPAKWTKVMHEGVSKDLKPKVKSIRALKKRYPHLVSALPTNRNGALYDGPVDALLIAAYGLQSEDVGDF